MVLKAMTLSLTLQMDTPSMICQKLDSYMTRKDETMMKMTLYRTLKKVVRSRREPISPDREYGASPKHLTNRIIGLKTVNVSAETAVILLHQESSYV
jgi:hypothetical protein